MGRTSGLKEQGQNLIICWLKLCFKAIASNLDQVMILNLWLLIDSQKTAINVRDVAEEHNLLGLEQ